MKLISKSRTATPTQLLVEFEVTQTA